MVIAVFQMIGLGQFVEGLVFNPPAPMPGLVNYLRGVAIQSGTGGPYPLTLSGFAAFASAPDPLFHPLFLRADDANQLAVFFAEVQVFDFPQPHLPVSLLIVKNHGLLAPA